MNDIIMWGCQVCGKRRPDEKISVLQKPLLVNGRNVGHQNVKYCNDNPNCLLEAQKFSFIGNKMEAI